MPKHYRTKQEVAENLLCLSLPACLAVEKFVLECLESSDKYCRIPEESLKELGRKLNAEANYLYVEPLNLEMRDDDDEHATNPGAA